MDTLPQELKHIIFNLLRPHQKSKLSKYYNHYKYYFVNNRQRMASNRCFGINEQLFRNNKKGFFYDFKLLFKSTIKQIYSPSRWNRNLLFFTSSERQDYEILDIIEIPDEIYKELETIYIYNDILKNDECYNFHFESINYI